MLVDFVSDDSLSTPSRVLQAASSDEPWFSVAELLRERIRAACVRLMYLMLLDLS